RAGVVVGVDDAHLLDELSALLVQQLVLRRTVRVVLTLRGGEPAPDAVTTLWKDGHLRRVEVHPLSAGKTATLLEDGLGGPVDSADARRLWEITRGNVLFLQQLVEGELEEGRLLNRAGVWRWTGQPALSPGLTELVQARMGRLSEEHRLVVEVLTLAAPLEVALLERLSDAVVVEQAEARGLIEVYDDGRRWHARLAHPLYGEVLRAQMGSLRARRLRGWIAQALADTGGRRAGDTLRRAVLMLESDLSSDAGLLSVAARHAIELLDLPLAAQLARAAVSAGGGLDSRLALGYTLAVSGKGAETAAELAALARLAETDAERLQATLFHAGNLFMELARPDEAEAVLAAAEETMTDPAVRLALTGIRAVVDAYLARPIRAASAALGVLATSEASPEAVFLSGWALTIAHGGLGRVTGLEETWRRVERLAYSFAIAPLRPAFREFRLRALCLAGLLADAEHTVRSYHELSLDVPAHARWTTDVLCGVVALERGHVQTAVRWLRQAASGLSSLGAGAWTFTCLVSLTQAIAMVGDGSAARETLVTLQDQPRTSFVFREPDVLLARAWVSAAEGALSEAVVLARQAGELAAAQGHPAVEVVALHTAVRFGDHTVAERLTELATQVDGPRAPAAAAHAAALAADDGDALQEASARLGRLGALLSAADAAAQAAVVHTRHDHRGSAPAAAVRAHRLAEECQGARTPALAAAATPLPLTDREREVATLAAQGLSNREIAERLVLSIRTVEGHLYHASAKLGASTRADLADLLHGDSPSATSTDEGTPPE
ncbi:MAG: LuxR C-terminal-related transcriptional regulator, partial [Sciscionella sp.]